MSREVKYEVSGFNLAGPYRNPEFESFDKAVEYLNKQSVVPSYISGRPLKGKIYKITTTCKDVTP